MRTLVLLALAIGIISCAQQEEGPKDIMVSGQIENANGDSIAFNKNGDITKFAVDSTGSFAGTLKGEKGYYQFSYSREYGTAFMSPGDDLKISFDSKQFDESMSYEGTGAAANNYLAAKFLLVEEQQGANPTNVLYSMDEDSFVLTLSGMGDEVLGLLEKTELDEAFKSVEKSNIKFDHLSKMDRYEAYHKYFAKLDSFEASEEFHAQFADIDYTNEADFNMIPAYRDLVMAHYFDGKLEKVLNNVKDVASTDIKDAVLDRLTLYLSPGTDSLETRVNEMKAMASSEDLKAELDKQYASMKVLTKGNASPEFNFVSVDGGMVSLESLKGKNVYIDVWATWCGPCKAEIPHLKTLEKDYHGKNIEFVSISVDEPKDEQKWRDMIADKELKGIQLMSDNGWDTGFVDNYLIKGIPRFILLDAEGNIVSADAPRPSSDEEIRGMIDELI